MTRSLLLICAIAVWTVIFCPMPSEAGTFMFGGKGWYAFWDSSVLDWFDKDIAAGYRDNGLVLTSQKDAGSGYLVGPFVGYQTENGKWSFSLAAMAFSSFSQDWSGATNVMVLQSEIDLSRMDFDFAVSYSLLDYKDRFFLLKYTKVFLGYKHQIVDIDFDLAYQSPMGPRFFEYKLDSTVKMPTLGMAFAYPVFKKAAVGLQIGGLYAIADLKMTSPDGQSYDIWPRPNFGFNGEFSFTFQPINHLICQLGYRAQLFMLEARSHGSWVKTESDDITHGTTFSIIYTY